MSFKLPSLVTICRSWKHHKFWNLCSYEAHITFSGNVALKVEGVKYEEFHNFLFFLKKEVYPIALDTMFISTSLNEKD
jgi:hypothetical protein